MNRWQFFTESDLSSMNALRQAYRKLVLEYHPDKHSEDEADKWTELFKALQLEYDLILSNLSRSHFDDAKTTYDREKVLQDMIDRLMKIPEVYVELCGCWLWVSGDTFMQRARLKLLGFKWSKKKARWYWGLTMTAKGKKKAKFKNMDGIYRKYGREVIGQSEAEEPLLIGGSS